MQVIEFFTEVTKTIHNYESDAKKALEANNNDLYIELMRKKANLLASLPKEIPSKSTEGLSVKAQSFAIEKCLSFSQSAENAIRLNSVWYMSQLLFDTDYKEGDPNNFDLFLEELKAII